MTVLPPAVPTGTKLCGYEVIGARGEELLARSPAGEPALLALDTLGSNLLSLEAEALRRLSRHSGVPSPLELGLDPIYGPCLALSLLDPSTRPLAEVARSLRLAAVVPLARQLVDLAERVAREGFAWGPFPQDFHLTSRGTLTLSRVRCTGQVDAPTSPEGEVPADVRSAFEAVGAALLPLPCALGPTRLVRLFSSRALRGAKAPLGLTAAREELALIETEMTVAPSETAKGITDLSDRGFRQEHNEDATAVAAGEIAAGARKPEEAWSVLVVCDGVSSSAHAAAASSIAATTTRDALAAFARSGAILSESAGAAMAAAIRSAHQAICEAAASMRHAARAPAEPPGTTVVAALVFRHKVVIGWAGDSRAYWISPGGAELLTRDHSWVAEAVARGDLTEAEANVSPLAHAITRCLRSARDHRKRREQRQAERAKNARR